MSNPVYFVSGLSGMKFLRRNVVKVGDPIPSFTGAKMLYVQAIGGGGGGGGAAVTTTSPDASMSFGSGGGAGGYADLWIPYNGTFNLTIGTGGAGGSGNASGSSGMPTTVGVPGNVITANGGQGGLSQSELTLTTTNHNGSLNGGNGGTASASIANDDGFEMSGGGGQGCKTRYVYNDANDLLMIQVGPGGVTSLSSSNPAWGNNILQTSASVSANSNNGDNGTDYGNGGAGAFAIKATSGAAVSVSGGNGADGVLIITQFS